MAEAGDGESEVARDFLGWVSGGAGEQVIGNGILTWASVRIASTS